MSEMVLQVRGMTCGGCENSVQRVLGSLPGVTEVKADHSSGEVRLRYDGDEAPTHDELSAAIEGAGFELDA